MIGNRLFIPTWWLAAGAAIVSALASPSSASADGGRTASELIAAGNGEVLWLVVGKWEPDQRKFLQRFAFMDKNATQPYALRVPLQIGSISRWAVVNDNLSVFFSDGSHVRYTRGSDYLKDEAHREIRLPDRSVPLAASSDSSGKNACLWAVVEAKTANRVDDLWQDVLREQATRPADDEYAAPPPRGKPASLTSRPSDRPEGSCHLVKYDGSHWEPGYSAPPGCSPAEQLQAWLCSANGRMCLFWQRNSVDRKIEAAWRENDQWVTGPSLSLPRPLQGGFAGTINNQLVFVAFFDDPQRQQTWECRTWILHLPGTAAASARWDELSPPAGEEGKPLQLPPHTVAGGFIDHLVLVRNAGENTQFGFWTTSGGAPTQSFRDLSLQWANPHSQYHHGLRSLATTLIVAAMLMLVFWRRHESLARVPALPPGLQLVSPAKRMSAALLDMVPAALIVGWYWRPELTIFMKQAFAPGDRGAMEVSDWPMTILIAIMVFRLIYAAYCILFELLWSTTPGKRLLGCAVLSESLNRPNMVQVVIRNLSRLLELEPMLQIWPFLLVIFFTRSRQRVGDLLARTIVVERQKNIVGFQDQDAGEDI